MELSRKDYIKQCLEKGMSRNEVKHELISLGYGSAGFEDEYTGLVSELGISELVPTVSHLQYKTLGTKKEIKAVPKKSVVVVGKPKPLMMVILAILFVGIGFSFLSVLGYVPTIDKGSNVSDRLVQSKVEATGASAHVFATRMGSYDGVCDDITVVDPVECQGDKTSFIVFAELSSGFYHCVDNSGFSGTVTDRPTQSCD